jgi:hypothetical protein
MKYRWDFNYTGENDINFDTLWSTSPKYSGFFENTGKRTVRLQVMDEDEAVDTTFLSFYI